MGNLSVNKIRKKKEKQTFRIYYQSTIFQENNWNDTIKEFSERLKSSYILAYEKMNKNIHKPLALNFEIVKWW